MVNTNIERSSVLQKEFYRLVRSVVSAFLVKCLVGCTEMQVALANLYVKQVPC